MRVLGIDPGMARCGYGVLEGSAQSVTPVEFGVLTTAPGPMAERLAELFSALEALIARSRPTRAAVEQLFFGQNASTAIAVGQARGVALLALARAGVPVVELAPSVVKQAVAGYGRADKAQIQAMVTRLLALPVRPKPDDAADALAVAWAALSVPAWEAAPQ